MLTWTWLAGVINPNCLGIIGSGVVIHVPSFFTELENLQKKGNQLIGFMPVLSAGPDG